jgi:AcrR family transcriptional regulator
MVNKHDGLQVKTSVKDQALIEARREQIVQAGIQLFKEKGFHRATTRELAKLAGFSIGTLYEYIRTKEDVLFLVCDNIYEKVMNRLGSFPFESGDIEHLKEVIRQYYLLIDSMQAEFTIMYQETKSLPKEEMRYVLEKEKEMAAAFESIIKSCMNAGALPFNNEGAYLAAHQIIILGQAWAFRKWALHSVYSIDEYIAQQTNLILNGILHFQQS